VRRLLFSLAVFLCMIDGATSAAPNREYWSRAIADAKKQSERYYAEARRRGVPCCLGTMFNEVDVPKHQCAILGRLLEKQEHVRHLEKYEVPPDAEDLQVFAQSRANFASVAEYLLSLVERQWVVIWNLDCAGKMDIPALASIRDQNPKATFHVKDGALFVLGDITAGFAEELARALAENSKIDSVALGSAGGSIIDAIKAGRMIRSLGLKTVLWANCYSACTIVFLGGVERLIWSPYPELGFHQASIYGVDISPGSEVYRLLASYAVTMGANPRFLLAAMFAATSSAIYVPDAELLCQNKITTWIQRRC